MIFATFFLLSGTCLLAFAAACAWVPDFARRVRLGAIRAVANWCYRRGRFRDITHRGQPYLHRYAIAGWLPSGEGRVKDDPPRRLPSLYLHHFWAPDADPAPHNHPWPWAVSLILSGAYVEVRFGRGSRVYSLGRLNWIWADTFHRVDTLLPEPGEPGVWTLFLVGAKRAKSDREGVVGSWGFAEGTFIPWRQRSLDGVHTSKRAGT